MIYLLRLGTMLHKPQINHMLSNCGTIVDVVKVDYKRNVMATMKWTHEWLSDAKSSNFEFLFLINKQ